MPTALIPLAVKANIAGLNTRRAIRREADRALSGDVSIEYVLIAALVSVALLTILGALGKELHDIIGEIVTALRKSADLGDVTQP